MMAELAKAQAALMEGYRARTPKSRAQFEMARQVLPGGNTRNNLHFAPYPPVIAKGDGSELVDLDGNVYTDFLNDYTVALAGHSHPALIASAQAQLTLGMNYGGRTIAEAELAHLMAARYPAVQSVRFVNSGTEANLYAILLARHVTKRPKILVFEGGYHGGVLNFGSGARQINIPFDVVTTPYNDAVALEAALEAEGESIAAVVLEPVMNSGGVIPATAGFCQAVSATAKRVGALLIFDEVMTARLSYHGMHGKLGITPDLVTFGKFIGGGFSFGAFGGRADIMAVFDAARPGYVPHGGSFNNNVFSMSGGVTALTKIHTPAAIAAVNDLGDRLRSRLNAALAEEKAPLCFSGYGSVMNLHVGYEPPMRYVMSPLIQSVRSLYHMFLLQEGYWIAGRALVSLSIANSQDECDGLVDTTRKFASDYRSLLSAQGIAA